MRRLLTAIVLTVVWVQLAAAQTIREIAQLPAASAISASDSIACQQGGVGTAYTRCTPGAILSAGLPGAFSTLAASSNATITGRLTVGSGAPITGGSRIFDAGYSATAWLMDMQRAGSNAAGARYGALKVSQQITHDGAGSAGTPGAVASLYSSLQVNGQPTTDYWAAGFLTYVTNLADSGATPGQSQHGAMYNQSVRTLDNVAGGTIPPGRQMAEMWGQWQVLSDRTGLKSSEGNSMVGMEFDWDGNNADDAGARFGYQMVLKTYLKNATSDNPFEVKYGFYMNSETGGVNDAFFNVPLAIYAGYTVAGIDLSLGTGPRANPYVDGTIRAVAIKLADARAISFDGGDLTTGAILVHGSSKLSYKVADTEMFSISDAGKIASASTATDSFTFPGGGTFGPSDYRQVEIANSSTSELASTTAKTLFVRRVGSNNSDFTTNDSWVTASNWVMTNTSAFASDTVLRRPRFNGKFSTSIADGVLPGETWNLYTSITTSAAEDASNTPYNNVAFYSQAVRADSPTTGVGTRLMGAVIEARDLSGDSAVKSGIIRTLELDMFVNGDDDYIDPVTTQPGIGREMMLFALGKGTTGASPTITSLIGVYPATGDGVTLKRGVTFANQLNFSQSLWDTRDAVQGASANAIWLRAGHRIALDGDSVAAATASTAYLYAATGNLKVHAPTVVLADGETGPITVRSNSIAAASGQNVFVSTGGAGNSWSIGNATAGLGAGLSVTTQSDGNRLFGASPNTVLASNRLTFATMRMSGSSYALNGTVTPTAFSGTGSTVTVTFAAITGIVIPVNSEVVISGASPSAYNGTWVVTSSTPTTVSFASSATGSLVTAGSMAYYMAVPSPFQITANWSGIAASTQQHVPFRFQAATDTSDTGATSQGMPILRIDHNWGGAAKGGKGGLQVQITQTSATNDPPDGVHPSQQHVALAAFATAAYNAGGTGTFANAAGNLYGMNPQVLLQGGATYWRSVNALGEVNLGVTGTSIPITLGGTVTAGDVLTIQFASADISGSPVSVSWTVGASQTLTMIANNLEAAVNGDSALSDAGISAVARDGVITIYYPTHIAALTITPSVSGGATETMTLGSVTAGASVDLKLMGSMIRLSSDTGPASLNSAFLMLGSQSNASRSGMFNYGIVFGGMAYFNSGWSWNANSTLIAANLQDGLGNAGKSGLLTPNLAGYGVDFRQVSFTNAAWRSPGFERAPSGSSIIGGYTISGDSGGLKLDTSTGKSATSVALASGGGGGAGVATNNYFVGDVGFAYGGVFVVDTVNTSTGAVATFTTVVPPYYTGSAPTNPVSVSGGSGAGWTVNITWPSAPVVQLQASGGDTVVGSGSAILTTATSGFLRIPTMAGTPTGVVAAGSLVYNTSAGKVCVSAGGGTWTDVVGGSC